MTFRTSSGPKVQIDILVCTFRRPAIRDTLLSLDAQESPAGTAFRIIVADNDETPSARALVSETAAEMSHPVEYLHAPARNISIARNACLDRAGGDWVAFIDDDERAGAGWLIALYRTASEGGLDAAFGPAHADYDCAAPDWIRSFNYHSNLPVTRGGEVQTGHTCNAILRWRGSRFERERFLREKGRSGGEDTEFFFRLWRRGARFGICEGARVYEAVDPERLTFDWIRQRKFRAGQSYGHHSKREPFASAGLVAGSCAKIASCAVMAVMNAFSQSKQRYWLLRGVFHCGVLTSQFGAREGILYGK